jgi:hypothetical protein
LRSIQTKPAGGASGAGICGGTGRIQHDGSSVDEEDMLQKTKQAAITANKQADVR